ncbi:hypothetical protein [Gluconobacter oxydans]|uniref:hypothetical protein n=1 Tax=Gluconobacter oxydans TaxID=442 RepID=UPI002647C8FA|nr:hypothetical protein [Gluconobacter oxydans]WKE49051.1 hypothetical protein NUJ38_04875 [Gluconobacter oxydans]
MLEEIKASITVAKLLVVGVVAVLAFWFGHHVAANAGKVKVEALQASITEYRRTEAAEAAKAYQTAATNAQANALSLSRTTSDRQAAQKVQDAAFQELKHEAETLPRSSCGLDADGVRLWNRANAAIGDERPSDAHTP